MRRMTRIAVRTPHTASGHISDDIISHLGADLEQTPKRANVGCWATTDTGTGPHGAIICPEGKPRQVLFFEGSASQQGFLPRRAAQLCYNKRVVISRRCQWPQRLS